MKIAKGIIPTITGILLLIVSVLVMVLNFQEVQYTAKEEPRDNINLVGFKDSSYYVEKNGNIGIEAIGKAYILRNGSSPEAAIPSIELLDMQMKKVDNKGNFSRTIKYGNSVIHLSSKEFTGHRTGISGKCAVSC
ncbi:hypothetical protein [Peribacillus sp. SCS-37]|uniref:hypothetical protein n=1 Tax=Paraperibacillus esterisolvens TaxID=3115296 RepID=UPI003906A1DC